MNLVELDLSNNFLTTVPIAALATLLNLKFLNLGANKIQVEWVGQQDPGREDWLTRSSHCGLASKI